MADTFKFPLDPTGVSANNKVTGEQYTFPSDVKLRVIAPRYGAFFTRGVAVVNTKTGATLTPGVDYYLAYQYDVPSARFSKKVAGLIVMKNLTVQEVSINYQVVGGDFAVDATHIVELLARRVPNNRSSEWAEILTPLDPLDVESEKFYRGSISGHEIAVMSINRLASSKTENDPLYTGKIKDYVRINALKIANDASASVQELIRQHEQDPTAHSQYARIADINELVPLVRAPSNVLPADGAVNVPRINFFVKSSQYFALYDDDQAGVHFQVAADPNFNNLVFDAGLTEPEDRRQVDLLLAPGARHYWRCRHRSETMFWSEWSKPTSFTTMNSGIATPWLAEPSEGQVGISLTPYMETLAFGTFDITDTHVSTDWEIRTAPAGAGQVVFASLNDRVNLTKIKATPTSLKVSTLYYARVRHNSASNGSSGWSEDIMFQTSHVNVPSDVGTPFLGGYYVGTTVIGLESFAIIVAPKSTTFSSVLQSNTERVAALENSDSVYNTAALVASGLSPAADKVSAMTTGGYTDWVIPSYNILDLMNTAIRPTLPRIPAIFRAGGSEAMDQNLMYWSSTLRDSDDGRFDLASAFCLLYTDGYGWNLRRKMESMLVRAVRLVNLKSIT